MVTNKKTFQQKHSYKKKRLIRAEIREKIMELDVDDLSKVELIDFYEKITIMVDDTKKVKND